MNTENTELSINNTENHAENTGRQSSATPPGVSSMDSHSSHSSHASHSPESEDDVPVSHWQRQPQNPNRPRSNVARLSCQVREMVNFALREGMDYREIIIRIGTLAGQDHGVTPSILSRWYKTGYKEWLRKTTHLEDTIAQSDAALTRLARLKSETGADLSDLIETFLASLLQNTLQDFDPAALKALMTEKPAEIFRLIGCLNANITARSSQLRAEIARVRTHIQVAEKEKTIKVEPVPAKKLYDDELIRLAFDKPALQQLRELVGPTRLKKIEERCAAPKPPKLHKKRHSRSPVHHPAPRRLNRKKTKPSISRSADSRKPAMIALEPPKTATNGLSPSPADQPAPPLLNPEGTESPSRMPAPCKTEDALLNPKGIESSSPRLADSERPTLGANIGASQP